MREFLLAALSMVALPGDATTPAEMRIFRDPECQIEFAHPATWTASVQRSNDACTILVNPPGWPTIRDSTEYVLNSENAIELETGPGTMDDWLRGNSCMELRPEGWWAVCGRESAPVTPFETQTLKGLHYEFFYGAFLRNGEGGYQGLTGEMHFALSDGRRYVSIYVAWCKDGCVAKELVNSIRLGGAGRDTVVTESAATQE